jgi:hypothetical protein
MAVTAFLFSPKQVATTVSLPEQCKHHDKRATFSQETRLLKTAYMCRLIFYLSPDFAFLCFA